MLYQENKCVSPLSDSCMRWEERSERERTVGEEYEASGGSPHGLWKKQDNISMSVIIEWPPQSHIQLSGEQEADGRRRYDEEEDIREWSALEKSATSHRWESAWIKITFTLTHANVDAVWKETSCGLFCEGFIFVAIRSWNCEMIYLLDEK